MQVKEYKVYKNISKTVKENNLFLEEETGNEKRLFDFSLLDNMDISEREKEVIKADAVQFITAGNRTSFYGKRFDSFTACDGIADYYVHRVFSAKGKHLYNIFQLADLKHNSKERRSIYEAKYHVNSCKVSSSYTKPTNDLEIA